MSSQLERYILKHTVGNACRCGTCACPGQDTSLPAHTANLVFFDVAIEGSPTREELSTLIETHEPAAGALNIWGGAEHTFLEVAQFIGDQGLALQLMGLGFLLDMWDLLTPYTLAGYDMPQEPAIRMAEAGAVAIQSRPHAVLDLPERRPTAALSS